MGTDTLVKHQGEHHIEEEEKEIETIVMTTNIEVDEREEDITSVTRTILFQIVQIVLMMVVRAVAYIVPILKNIIIVNMVMSTVLNLQFTMVILQKKVSVMIVLSASVVAVKINPNTGIPEVIVGETNMASDDD